MDAYVGRRPPGYGPLGEKLRGREIATVYLAGGTPSLLERSGWPGCCRG